jgi:hypothetical protein
VNKTSLRDLETALSGTSRDERFKEFRKKVKHTSHLDHIKGLLQDEWWNHSGEEPPTMQSTISAIQEALDLGNLTELDSQTYEVFDQIFVQAFPRGS